MARVLLAPQITLLLMVGLAYGFRIAGVAILAMAVVALMCMTRLGAGRPWAWLGAVLVYLLGTAAYGWFVHWATTSPVREPMLDAAGIFVGVPLTLMCLAGLVCLLLPATVRYCVTSESR